MLTTFLIALTATASMLAYMIPGFILTRTKLVKEKSISAFATMLLYICTPCLYACVFRGQVFSRELILKFCIFSLFAFAIQLLVLGLVSFLFRKKFHRVKYRIIACSTALGNCSYFGIPLVEHILPEYTLAPVFASAFGITLNILNFMVTCAVILGDRKQISVKKAFLNPASYGLYVALILLLSGLTLPAMAEEVIYTLGRMSTPLSMIIIGMRLGLVKFKELFGSAFVYPTALAKLVFMPLLAYAILYFLPIEANMKITAFLLCCCPTASSVLSFSEMLGEGQKEAACSVMISTIFSIIFIPLMSLMVL